ncbi:carbohydrate ABC transporter permease [Bifidobacterium avesanii]|uniref:ABC transporter permease subunit n=1 Tax=Bifidobacterium avesanii TaxID=1798157 RepID=A0A7K3TIT9_9BIFI|nr:sugar ABC transporter permease [Bifidobacterium avesanii]KAB8291926.1 ABC transporter permease [Bifidobacterium avesanii]NEG79028.1 ABC transporter permease subunit [Bifidobacterium avesanii]
MTAVSAHAGIGAPAAKPRKEKMQHIGMLWCLPYVIVFLGGTIIPMVYAFYLGLYKQRMIGGETFAGLSNYIRALKDPLLWNGFGRVLLYGVIQVPLMTALSLLAALMLDSQRIKHVAIPRILLFLPYAVPNVIAALMWSYIYGTDYGLFGQFFALFGAESPDMMSADLMVFAFVNISTWVSMGYNTLIYYSSLRALPEELYESARMDGATEFRIAWSVKIPQIRSSVVMTLLFNIIYALQLFNTPSMMQTIAPEVVTSYYTPNLYTYSLAFQGQDVNYAAAVSLVVGLFTMVIVTVVKTLGNKWEEK